MKVTATYATWVNQSYLVYNEIPAELDHIDGVVTLVMIATNDKIMALQLPPNPKMVSQTLYYNYSDVKPTAQIPAYPHNYYIVNIRFSLADELRYWIMSMFRKNNN